MITGYGPEKYTFVCDCVQPMRPLHNQYKNSGTIAIGYKLFEQDNVCYAMCVPLPNGQDSVMNSSKKQS